MSYTKELLEKDQVKLTFDVAEADWKAALDESFNKNKNKFSVEGFRKGHVPRKVVERVYGIGVLFDDALDIVMQKEYEAALEAETQLNKFLEPAACNS